MRRPLTVGLLLLAAAALRALPLTDNRFHPDEALYATFGRLIATGRDPWLASAIVDKPPLPFYLMGGVMAMLGPSELAARLPSLFASILSVPLLYSLGRQLYDRDTAGLAALALALSPLAISFAPTAFLDPLHTTFVLWAMLGAARGRWAWTGVAIGLALATKQTTLAFAPLIVWLLVSNPANSFHKSERSFGSAVRRAVFLVGPIGLSAVVITAWDASRDAPISFWAQGLRDNVPGTLASAQEWLPRLGELFRLMYYITASWPLNLLLGAGLFGLIVWRPDERNSPARRRDVALSAFIFAYLAAYWLGGFNLWDRYFLVLTPFICLLLARALMWLARRVTLKPLIVAGAVLVAGMAAPAVIAAGSGYPVGGDHGAYDGIDQVADYLRPIPQGAVLYDHWLSWEMRYYLDDAPIYLVWMPDPTTLTTDLLAFGHTSPRYFVWPSWEIDPSMRLAAEAAGFAFESEFSTRRRDGTESFVVYRLVAQDE